MPEFGFAQQCEHVKLPFPSIAIFPDAASERNGDYISAPFLLART